jgi:hypothetical protein
MINQNNNPFIVSLYLSRLETAVRSEKCERHKFKAELHIQATYFMFPSSFRQCLFGALLNKYVFMA